MLLVTPKPIVLKNYLAPYISTYRAIVLISLTIITSPNVGQALHSPRYLSTSPTDNKSSNRVIARNGNSLFLVHCDERLLDAASIAQHRARSRSTSRCWRYVKIALLRAKVIHSYPNTTYAKQAAKELTLRHGFIRTAIQDPYRAPVGAVIVYGGKGPGHVEIRTKSGFVSDFISKAPSSRPLIGIYVKPIWVSSLYPKINPIRP